jgi:hypothetical protein
MVRPSGFEPPTFCSGGKRSIQLSYGRTSMKLAPLLYLSPISAGRLQTARVVTRKGDSKALCCRMKPVEAKALSRHLHSLKSISYAVFQIVRDHLKT